MPDRLHAALRLVLDAVADGQVTTAEGLDIIAALLPRDVVIDAAEDLLEVVRRAIRKVFDRNPDRMRRRADRLDAKGEHDEAAELRVKAAEVEARQAGRE